MTGRPRLAPVVALHRWDIARWATARPLVWLVGATMPSGNVLPDKSVSDIKETAWIERSHWKIAALLVFSILAFASVVLLLYASQNTITPHTVDFSARTQACRVEVSRRLDSSKLPLADIETISNLCYNQVRGESILRDFNLRRSNLTEQLVDGKIILWMVVVITLSGVALAALQLYAAYNLSLAGRESISAPQEFILEKDRISLKSSVTGLMILVVSFGFFIVYVMWVYTAKELRQENPELTSVGVSRFPEPIGPPLESGGIGPLPATEAESENPDRVSPDAPTQGNN